MQCNMLVKYALRGRSKNKVPRPVEWISWYHIAQGGPTYEELLEQGYERCDGTIKAAVAAVDEPYMGGSSAVFEISYCCDKCGGSFYPHLPQSNDDVNAMLTRTIAQDDYETAVAAEDVKRQAEIERRREWDREFQRRRREQAKKDRERRARQAETTKSES